MAKSKPNETSLLRYAESYNKKLNAADAKKSPYILASAFCGKTMLEVQKTARLPIEVAKNP
jgi:hypothetical protein